MHLPKWGSPFSGHALWADFPRSRYFRMKGGGDWKWLTTIGRNSFFFSLSLFPNLFSFLLILVEFPLSICFPSIPLYAHLSLIYFMFSFSNMWKVLCNWKAQYKWECIELNRIHYLLTAPLCAVHCAKVPWVPWLRQSPAVAHLFLFLLLFSYLLLKFCFPRSHQPPTPSPFSDTDKHLFLSFSVMEERGGYICKKQEWLI